MKRNILLKIILITVTIGALLAAAAVVKKNADAKNKVPEKNSAAVETIQTKKATVSESDFAELKEYKEQKEIESDFAEQKETEKEIESDLAEPEESNEQADSGIDIDIKEQEEYGKPDSEGKSEPEDKPDSEEKPEPEEKPEAEEKSEPEGKSESEGKSDTEEKQEPAITDSPYGHEIYIANGVLQYGENASEAQMGKDVNTGSTVECLYPIEVMTTRVMYDEHCGYHTYKGYYTVSDKTEILDCLVDAMGSPLFNADTAMFQGVMGIYRCGSVVFTCLGIVE